MCEEEGGARFPFLLVQSSPWLCRGTQGAFAALQHERGIHAKCQLNCLILPSTAPALPRTCGDLDAF